MKIVFILSDALRHDYIQYMPFLKEMSEEYIYYKNVTPGIGFCEISEYLTGISSLDNGNLFQITFTGKYDCRKFKTSAKINNICNHIPRLRRYTQRAFEKYLKHHINDFDDRDILQVRYNIPIDMINFFQPTESRLDYDSEDFFPESNLFQYLGKHGYSYDIDDFVKHNKIIGTDEERLSRLNKKIQNRELADFTMLYIGVGEIAHMTGTLDVEFHDKLAEYDRCLKNSKDLLDNIYGDEYRFIILGDHGMVDIEKYININPLLHKLKVQCNLKIGEDFIYFIDSTALRIWVNEKEKLLQCDAVIRDFLKNELDDIHIQNNFYGDLIYMLKPGKVFFPDFFNTKKNKGMHGYTNEICEQKGLCVIIGAEEHKVIDNLELKNAKNIITDLL